MNELGLAVTGVALATIVGCAASACSTGGIGGLIYTSPPTDVYGKTKLTVRMIDVASGRQVTKTYAGSSRERIAKLRCDLHSTRSKMVGQSLTSVMQEFRTDLVSFTAQPASP
jgi:hypothetical protein